MSRNSILILLVPFYILFNIFLPLALSFILLVIFCHIGRKVAVKLSKLEIILTFCSALFILIIIGYVLIHDNSLISWVYRNSGLYLSWRFAIAFLIGVPISIAIRKYPDNKPAFSSKSKLNIVLFSLLILFIGILLLPIVFISFGKQLIFGYLQSMLYNPLQIVIPIILAIGLHFYFLKPILAKSNQYRQLLFSTTLIIWITGILFLSTSSLLFLRPTRYENLGCNWIKDYLSQKYAIKITYEKLDSYPQPLKIVKDQPIPSAVVFKYLTFGEKAIDYSSLND